MREKLWQEILLPSGDEDQVWELFHENSKNGRYQHTLSEEQVLSHMNKHHESLPFDGYPIVDLPSSGTPPTLSLGEAVLTRSSALSLTPCQVTLESLASLLHYGYGITRDNKGTTFPRPLRASPSAGALYPLEIFLHSTCISGLEAGIYHYNPSRSHLRFLDQGDKTKLISESLMQPHVALAASLIVFITAIFERTVFKYGDRGYRYCLLEVGHVSQNMNLVSNALGIACMNIGGFYDRSIDSLLGLDGLTHSTLYAVAFGGINQADNHGG